MNYYDNEEIKDLKLRGEILYDNEYVDCDFYNCSFTDVTFNNCSFKECKFHNCIINTCNFINTTMRNSTLIKGDFVGVNWNNLIGDGYSAGPIYSIEKSFFKYNNFIALKLKGISFSGSKFQESLFEDCYLVESKFKDVQFQSTQFIGCNLMKSDFRGAFGYIIDLESNNIKNGKFSFPEVTSLLNSLNIIIE